MYYAIVMSDTNNISFEKVEGDESKMNSIQVQAALNSDSIEEQVDKYIKEHNPSLCILTPCYGGLLHANYTQCLINTMILFRELNFPIQVLFCKNDSLVSRARNNLIAKGMHDTRNTHFLFIDSDITWSPLAVLKMILANKQLIGGAYPVKSFKWEKLLNPETNAYDPSVIPNWVSKKNNHPILKDTLNDIELIQSSLLRYNVNYLDNYLQIEQSLTKVKHIATGFMLMQRNMLEKMMLAYPSTKYTDDVNFLAGSENNYAYALFDCGVEDGHYLSEDWLFCNRWSRLNCDIWLDVSINLTHSGNMDYVGSFVSSII